MTRTREIDEEKVRDKAVRRLERAADLAYKMLLDERIDAKTRQGWSKRFTDAVRTLSHVLNDRELGEIDKRLNQVLDYRKKLASQMEPQSSNTEPNKDSAGS